MKKKQYKSLRLTESDGLFSDIIPDQMNLNSLMSSDHNAFGTEKIRVVFWYSIDSPSPKIKYSGTHDQPVKLEQMPEL